MKKLYVALLLVAVLLSGCSNTRYLMCGTNYDLIQDKGIGVIAIGIVANLSANYAANECVTFKIIIPFGESDKVLERSKNSEGLQYVKTSIDFSNYQYTE